MPSTFARVGRYFYSLAICGLGLQQLQHAAFRPVLVPGWPAWLCTPFWGYASGGLLILAGLVIAFTKKGALAAFVLGSIFFILFLACHVPNQFYIIPYSFHLGLWSDALKELALSGGAFLLANELAFAAGEDGSKPYARFAGIGRVFFCLMLICFGIDHFIYTEFVVSLVPAWMPGHVFWTYFSGVALAGSGLAILFNIFRKPVSLLLALMLFLWVIVLHIPRAAVATATDKGNELTSVFEAVAFSGVALLIAELHRRKNRPKPGVVTT